MLSYSIFVSACIYFSYQDIMYGEIARIHLWVAIIATLCVKEPIAVWENFGGAALGILLFSLAYYISKKRLGLADIWFSGFIGAFLGIIKWYAAVSIASMLALIFFICSRNEKKIIPFIPFLSIGACTTDLITLLCSLDR